MTPGTARGRSWYAAVRDSWPVAAATDVMAMKYWSWLGRRENDIFLCSYPKSGRTWLRFLLTYYQIRLFDVDYPLTLRNFPPLSPNVTLFSVFRLQDPPTEAPIHRILGTHSELPVLFRGLPLIMLRRDLRDTLVSFYYRRRALGEFRGDLESFLRSPWGLRHAVRYHNRWCRALAGVHGSRGPRLAAYGSDCLRRGRQHAAARSAVGVAGFLGRAAAT